MSEHTKEPWVVNTTKLDGAVVYWHISGTPYGSSYPICEHKLKESLSGRGPDANEQIENARRIVACVNACSGIPTEELEKAGTIAVEVQDEMQNELLKAWQQREKLLAASQAALDWIKTQNGVPVAMQDRLYEAIAEIEATK